MNHPEELHRLILESLLPVEGEYTFPSGGRNGDVTKCSSCGASEYAEYSNLEHEEDCLWLVKEQATAKLKEIFKDDLQDLMVSLRNG